MYEGNTAELQMTRMVLEEGFFDVSAYPCRVITYNQEEERIFLLSEEAKLPVFSLDGIYRLTIWEQDHLLECNGVILERYWNKLGKVAVFQIKTGFYKKLIN